MIPSQVDERALENLPGAGANDEIAVVVSRIDRLADGVVGIIFSRRDQRLFPEWTPGAHIDLLIGDGIERQYSLCGIVADREHLEIAVLREPESRGGSLAVHEKLTVGDELVIRGPRNNFPLIEASDYIFIAGGIGITPLLPMIAQVDKEGRSWKLLYGGRSRASMAFLDTVQVYGDHVLVQPENEMGLLDIAGWVGAQKPGKVVFCCGPERLIAAVESQCTGWPEDAVQVERFKPADGALAGQNSIFEVVLARSGTCVQVGEHEAIADALERVGVHVPRSCNEGTCGTCITKVLEGLPDHRDSFLRGRMRNENKKIMVCCSRALTDRLVLDV